MHPKELPGDMGLVEPHFVPYGHSFSVGLRKVHGLHQNVPSAQKSFWTHPMILLGDKAQVKAHFGPFGDSANLDAR